MSDPLPLRTEFLFRMTLGVGAPQHTGPSTGVERRVVPVTSGTFEGPSIKGELVPGTAGDWIRIEPDGTSHLDVRMVLKTDKGATLYVSYTGVRAGDKEVLARVAQGTADPSEYYFRTHVRFETSDPELDWLNRVLGVGVGHRLPSGPFYDVYVVR